MEDDPIWGILGGGFGLYGYLPAILKQDSGQIIVSEKHKTFIGNRPELCQYQDRIKWVKSSQDVIAEASSLILAVTPLAQEELIRALQPHKKFHRVMLEKPVATSPEFGKEILDQVISKATSVRVGYSFLYSSWADSLRWSFLEKDSYLIQWHFRAHHFRENQKSWKTDHKLGGGALRFYGVHLIAFLGSIGQARVEFSRLFQDNLGHMVRWQACLTILGGAVVAIDLDCNSKNEQFMVYRTSESEVPVLQLRTPFSDAVQFVGEDNRIGILQKLIGTFTEPNYEIYSLYHRVNSLWQEVENETEFVHSNSFMLNSNPSLCIG